MPLLNFAPYLSCACVFVVISLPSPLAGASQQGKEQTRDCYLCRGLRADRRCGGKEKEGRDREQDGAVCAVPPQFVNTHQCLPRAPVRSSEIRAGRKSRDRGAAGLMERHGARDGSCFPAPNTHTRAHMEGKIKFPSPPPPLPLFCAFSFLRDACRPLLFVSLHLVAEGRQGNDHHTALLITSPLFTSFPLSFFSVACACAVRLSVPVCCPFPPGRLMETRVLF